MQFAVTVHGLIKREDKYLFIKRNSTAKFAPEKWDTPGGSLEFGETPEQGVIRETFEETGLQIQLSKLLAVSTKVVPELEKQFINVLYECNYVGGEISLNFEHTDHVWLELNEVGCLELVDYLQRIIGQVILDKKTSC